MGLFEKKYCDFCGQKIGLLGNKKLEDGNMCKECASKLSPWFSERRHSTVAEIQEQLNYREENKKQVADFTVTQKIGRYTKILFDEEHGKFMVTSATDLTKANPDVLDFSQVTGCRLEIDEREEELKQEGEDGKRISYDPPRYEYSYDFHVDIGVKHPYFDRIRYDLSNGYVKTGDRPAAPDPGGWQITYAGSSRYRLDDYYEFLRMGNEIKMTIDRVCFGIMPPEPEPEPAPAPVPPAGSVVCPCCLATTVPDENGCCEYCGSPLNVCEPAPCDPASCAPDAPAVPV